MLKSLPNIHPIFFLIVATTLEVAGDAIVRIALYDHPGVSAICIGLFVLGAVLLFGYGTFVNLAPLEFGQVVGLYIATLFVVWQIQSYLFFRAIPTIPILVGGALIVVGGGIVSFWKA
jgi:small multidrug resistance family-3 protein